MHTRQSHEMMGRRWCFSLAYISFIVSITFLLLRISENGITKRVLQWSTQGRRKCGLPNNWKKICKKKWDSGTAGKNGSSTRQTGFPLSCLQRKFQNFSRTPKKTIFRDSVIAQQCSITDKQQSLTLYIQCDSTIHRKTFITSCKETVWLVHSRNTSYIYLHVVFYK